MLSSTFSIFNLISCLSQVLNPVEIQNMYEHKWIVKKVYRFSYRSLKIKPENIQPYAALEIHSVFFFKIIEQTLEGSKKWKQREYFALETVKQGSGSGVALALSEI